MVSDLTVCGFLLWGLRAALASTMDELRNIITLALNAHRREHVAVNFGRAGLPHEKCRR